ncbi:MAG: tRNA 2-selenouridine(34) synthase MnmH [Chlorobi bacterium]|nr:tRNA 2-selenouridine(34) synthase MnmH [Chlorobiota bacterium]
MIKEIDFTQYLQLSENIPIVDVRSPAEFEKGHIPKAYNIPLFSNEERALVGTAYVQESKEKALKLGYQYVTPKLNSFVSSSLKLAPEKKIAVHCWRGGMRSRAFAEHLNSNGFTEVYQIIGGYKAFRNYILNYFTQKANLIILGGYTGSGKTHILKYLEKNNLQVVDLEGIANHKGSVFGAIGLSSQPSVEQFENNLFWKWKNLNLSKPIILEDESHRIGSVTLPMELFKQMRIAPVIFLDIPKKERAKNLVLDYVTEEKNLLIESINKITKRLGGLNTKKAIEFIEQNNFYEAALIILNYYDKSYLNGLKRREEGETFFLKPAKSNHKENAQIITNFIKGKEWK